MSTYTIGIAGGGLLGRLCAWRLARNGHRVSLFEAGSFRHCAGAARTAAAMISPLSELVDSERLIFEMGLAGLPLWRQWVQELNRPELYRQTGSLVVAHQQDLGLLRQFSDKLRFQLGNTFAHDSSAPCGWLDQWDIVEREPDLAGFQRALYLPNEAYLDNRQFLDLLIETLQQLPVKLHDHQRVEKISPGTITTDKDRYQFDWAIDCRGMGAKPELAKLRGVRGEVLWVETPEVSLNHPVRFMHPKYKLYVVPKPGQQFIIGATEIESEDCSPISVRSTLELTSALYALNPAFAEARILETDVNLRPALQDNLPHIQHQHGLLRANGLYRHGYLLAPIMVETLVGLVERAPDNAFTHSLLGDSLAC